MHTTTRPALPAQEQQEPTAAPARRQPMGLDARMKAASETAETRCKDALLRLDVDSAAPETRLALADIIRVPLAPMPEATPHQASTHEAYTTPAAVTLHRAARLLEGGGWCRGSQITPAGERCLYGAIHTSAPDSRAERNAMDILLEVARRRWPDADSVPRLNDARLRDAADAVQLLDTAARVADCRGL